MGSQGGSKKVSFANYDESPSIPSNEVWKFMWFGLSN